MQVSTAGFQILDNQADFGFHAWGPNLHDLFAECARALTSLLVEPACTAPVESSSVEIIADNLEGLLCSWLAEIIYLFESDRKFFSDFDVVSHRRNGDTEFLQADLGGQLFDPDVHRKKTVVKSVCSQRLKIEHGEQGYVAHVFLDVDKS